MTSFSVLVSFLVSYFCHNEAEMSSEHLRVLFFFQEQTGTLCMRSVNSLELSGIMADQSSLFPVFFSQKKSARKGYSNTIVCDDIDLASSLSGSSLSGC